MRLRTRIIQAGPTTDIILYFDNIYIYIVEGRGGGDGDGLNVGKKEGKEENGGGGSGLARWTATWLNEILGVRREAGYIQLYRDTRFVRTLIHDMGSRSPSKNQKKKGVLCRGAFTYSAGDLRQPGAISGRNSRSGGGRKCEYSCSACSTLTYTHSLTCPHEILIRWPI